MDLPCLWWVRRGLWRRDCRRVRVQGKKGRDEILWLSPKTGISSSLKTSLLRPKASSRYERTSYESLRGKQSKHIGTMVENGKKHRQNSHLIIGFPTSEGASEVSKRANKWAQRRAWVKRAVQSERCERTSKRTSEWHSTSVCVFGWSSPQCDDDNDWLSLIIYHSVFAIVILDDNKAIKLFFNDCFKFFNFIDIFQLSSTLS